MTGSNPAFIAFPALLRAARNVYAARITAALGAEGYGDMPKNGIYVLGSIAAGGKPLKAIIRDLAVSKQAAGQLLDTLVLRGYIARSVDAKDRRRLTIHPTERGRHAAEIALGEIRALEERLESLVGAGNLAIARDVLAVLIGSQDGGNNEAEG